MENKKIHLFSTRTHTLRSLIRVNNAIIDHWSVMCALNVAKNFIVRKWQKRDKIQSLICHLTMCAWMMVSDTGTSTCPFPALANDTFWVCAMCACEISHVWEEGMRDNVDRIHRHRHLSDFYHFLLRPRQLARLECAFCTPAPTHCVATFYYVRSAHATDWHFDDDPLGCDNNRNDSWLGTNDINGIIVWKLHLATFQLENSWRRAAPILQNRCSQTMRLEHRTVTQSVTWFSFNLSRPSSRQFCTIDVCLFGLKRVYVRVRLALLEVPLRIASMPKMYTHLEKDNTAHSQPFEETSECVCRNCADRIARQHAACGNVGSFWVRANAHHRQRTI